MLAGHSRSFDALADSNTVRLDFFRLSPQKLERVLSRTSRRKRSPLLVGVALWDNAIVTPLRVAPGRMHSGSEADHTTRPFSGA